MKTCSACKETKRNKEFYKKASKCKPCARKYQLDYIRAKKEAIDKPQEPKEPIVVGSTSGNPKELCMKRMLSGAKSRAREKGIDFNIDYSDIQVPNLCPILKIPLVVGDGVISDNSPTLDRLIPHLGYTKGNVKVISSLANRIKTNATSLQILAVAQYVHHIEEENT